MQYYQELTLIKSRDITLYALWSKVYMQFHLALVNYAKRYAGAEDNQFGVKVDIGVCFPEYRCEVIKGREVASLGYKLRVFAHTKDELAQLDLAQALERLSDFVHIKNIYKVPENIAKFCVVKRFRSILNREDKALEFAKKYNLDFTEVKISQINNIAQKLNISFTQAEDFYEKPKIKNLPYISLPSLHTENDFKLRIEQVLVDKAVAGSFSTYGMSSSSTVPVF